MTDASRPVRVLLAKPGLDGHDRGVKVIAMGLRDAGAEVVYLGLRQTVDMMVRAAEDEDVDVIGLSVLSGAHLSLTERLLERLRQRNLSEIPVVVGGTIPPHDVRALLQSGVAAVFPVGSRLPDVVEAVLALGKTT